MIATNTVDLDIIPDAAVIRRRLYEAREAQRLLKGLLKIAEQKSQLLPRESTTQSASPPPISH